MKDVKDATTAVTSRKDEEDGWTRTALVSPKKNVMSVDILSSDGKFFCRLNITVKDDLSWGNVDVILSKKQVGTFLAWREGRTIVREELPKEVVAHAVDIKAVD